MTTEALVPLVSRGGPERRAARPDVRTGFRLATIAGVEVRVDWSLLLIFALLTFNLGAGVLPTWHPQWPAAARWFVAGAAATLFFASILAHEMSHALVGRTQGIVVRRITLFIFGGMAHMENRPPTPKAELLMAVVGPVTSIAIGMGATLGAIVLSAPMITPALLSGDPKEALELMGVGATLLLWLGPVNLVLGVFNLIPGFPLDGGRVLRALLWWWTGDLVKATRWAAGSGQLFSWAIMSFGVVSLFSGMASQGVWFLVIGWFLGNAARGSYQEVVLHHALEAVPLTRVMRTHLDLVTPELSVDAFIHDYVMLSDQRTFPVLDGDQLVGIVRLEDIRDVPKEAWSSVVVGAVMKPLAEIPTLSPEQTADLALDAFASRGAEEIAVAKDGHLFGVVQLGDLIKFVRLHEPASA